MWIFLPNSMLSIVQKPGDAKAGTLTVRSRIAGDIEAVFPDAKVEEGGGTDYQFRARVPRELVAKAMHDAVLGVEYSNFKGAVRNHQRHDAYMLVWRAMFDYQQKSTNGNRKCLDAKTAIEGEDVIVKNAESPMYNQIGQIWKVKRDFDGLKISVSFDGEVYSFRESDLVLA